MKLWNRINTFVARAAGALDREEGQTMVEYGLIIALVAVIAIAGLIVFGPAVSSLLSKLGASV